MTPAMIAALIASLPQLIQLSNSMIQSFSSGNSSFTESDVLAIQNQVANSVAAANAALDASMANAIADQKKPITNPTGLVVSAPKVVG